MAERIDRRECKARARNLLETAQVSPLKMVALWLGLKAVLSFLGDMGQGANLLYVFLLALTLMLSLTLDAGFVLYCMAVRRGERAEYLTLFDGFAFAGKVILLTVAQTVFVALWSLLFVLPGLVAFYRYRFALYNLLENPELGVMEALRISKRQTNGFKGQLFALDMSYLGWGLLAALPSLAYRQAIQIQVYSIVGSSAYWNIQDVVKYINPNVFGMPEMAWEFLIVAWSILVSVFYAAQYQCVELEYFDMARRASDVPQEAENYAASDDSEP